MITRNRSLVVLVMMNIVLLGPCGWTKAVRGICAGQVCGCVAVGEH